MNAYSVPKVVGCSETENYRLAVSTILNDIQRDTGFTWHDIAERLDVSIGTIYAARDKRTDLSGVFLMRIGTIFGGSYLNPLLKIAQIQAAPLDGTIEADVLPILTCLVHKIAKARDPEGPGGVAEVPQERSEYLPDLKRAVKATGELAKHIEEALA